MRWRILVLIAMVWSVSPNQGRADEPFFPIMAWDHPPDDPAAFRRMRDCGLTIAGFVRPEGLDHCREAGLKAIVADERTSGYDWTKVDTASARARVAELVQQVRGHPAVYGYELRDEPSASFFPGLAVVSDAIKRLHPGAWPYINLFPNYAQPAQLGAPDYEAYLERFIETCRPPILSYDHYALMEGGGLRDGYFANLESIRRSGLKHDLPFWNVVLTAAHFNYREPTAADMRFQVFTSLAYGARGIAYFTYFTVPAGNFRMAPVDPFGAETETWAHLRAVNLQVAQLAPTLLKLRSDAVYHFGEVPAGGSGPDAHSLIKAMAGPLLVGDFTHEDGTRYVMIVNRDFNASALCAPEFREPLSRVETISPYTGQADPLAGGETFLAPGQGVLLKLLR